MLVFDKYKIGLTTGGTMTSDSGFGLSPQELEERFDLLATDAKEYAVFLIGLDGRLLC